MKLAEFKIWFSGLTAGVGPNVGLSASQLTALKQAISDLEADDDLNKIQAKEGTPPTATSDVKNTNLDEFMKELERKREEDRRRKNIWSWNHELDEPLYGTYPSIQDSAGLPDILSFLRNHIEGTFTNNSSH